MPSSSPVPIPAHLAVEIEPFTDDELDEAIDRIWEGARDRIPAKVGQFELSDEGRAEWAMRKLAAFRSRLKEIGDQFDDWAERIETERAIQTRRLEARCVVFEGALKQYGVNRRGPKGENATTNLPSGTIKTQLATKPTIDFADEAAFARWARRTLPDDQLAEVIKENPKVYILKFRKLHVRARKVGESYVVEWSETGDEPWVVVPGASATDPVVKPSVTPRLGG